MRKYRTFGEVEEEYFRKHPEEIEDYLSIRVEESAKDAASGAQQPSVNTVGRAKGLLQLPKRSS
jgi:HTH-type transcriptional regulator/antitoxin HigA